MSPLKAALAEHEWHAMVWLPPATMGSSADRGFCACGRVIFPTYWAWIDHVLKAIKEAR